MNQIIAVAHDFTSEARNKLDHMNAIMFYLSDFGWTDERWSFIRDKKEIGTDPRFPSFQSRRNKITVVYPLFY
jgi:hypothetical protein